MTAGAEGSALRRGGEILVVNLQKKGLPLPLAQAATPHVHRLLGYDQFNRVYGGLPPCTPADFSQTFLDALNVRIELDGAPLQTIPATGPLVVVANHPLGLLDGMVLDAVLRRVRPDVAVMAHTLMAVIPEYREQWFFVGRAGSRSRRTLTMRSLRRSMRWLADGGALVMFPAARVARFHWSRLSVADRAWNPHIVSMALQTGAPVLPVYLHGARNRISQLLGAVLPLLQNVRAIGAVEDYRGRTLRVSLGTPIQPAELSGFASGDEAIRFLRDRSEQLV